MSTEPIQIQTQLPENAYRELKPGEAYTPMVPAGVTVPEITGRSIAFGIVMNIIFSMAATYLALKVGQGIETAIPISILAVGFSGFMLRSGSRASSLLENVNILAISTTSGIVAGGTVFTMPAIYILNLNGTLKIDGLSLFLMIFLVPLLGAILGVLLLVPFRRYFVRDMHGKLPFPEGTATNEILVTGASGGSQAIVLIYSFLLGMVYNWLSSPMKLFSEEFTTAAIPKIESFTHRIKAVFSLGTGAEFLGLGYIIGVRYASIIVAGSFLSWFVIIPLLAPLNYQHVLQINGEAEAHHGEIDSTRLLTLPMTMAASLDRLADKELSDQEKLDLRNAAIAELRPAFMEAGHPLTKKDAMITVKSAGKEWKIRDEKRTYELKADAESGGISVMGLLPGADDLFLAIPRSIGIGCIFAAGLLSILKMSKVIATALRQALGGLFKSSGGLQDRTDTDISYPVLLLLGLVTAAAIWAYFRFVALHDIAGVERLSLIALVLAIFVAFVFTTVSAWAIAMISVTPISGMTVTTIIITAVALLAAGLPKSEAGMLATLLVGGVVASALSMAGTLVTEFKIGYWVGASPRRIQWSAILASVLASAVVTATIMILAKSPGYDSTTSTEALQAPQANLMATALKSFVGSGDVPWTVYGVGVVIALLLQMLGISPLAFGLGMYLPMALNTPILIGAIVAWMVQKSSSDPAKVKGRNDKGILLASGLIAGAAIIGVVKSVIKLISKDVLDSVDISSVVGDDAAQNWAGLIAFGVLCLFVYLDCLRAKPSQSTGSSLQH
ncbi:MAG: OPT/YSL family transporter [Phycisphaerae bacterium]|nr:OPT/YSL family transporter [Phycisphaerae bacterium]